jgi:hypothetical protein
MSPFFYVLTLSFLFGTPLIIFAMKYASASYQARARVAGDDAYRALAQRAVTAQSESAASLSSMRTELSEISARLVTVEKILKAVE